MAEQHNSATSLISVQLSHSVTLAGSFTDSRLETINSTQSGVPYAGGAGEIYLTNLSLTTQEIFW